MVLTKGQVLGGDSGFSYEGTYEVSGEAFTAKVCVRNFDPAVPNVLGVPSPFDLLINARMQGEAMTGTGALAIAPDSKIVVRLKKSTALK